ncbi:MAG: DUF2730 family protein [Alphaproteobacteria bacterium]|nr:DUF2730 family protein [Alphaproteobacteria bacterium]
MAEWIANMSPGDALALGGVIWVILSAAVLGTLGKIFAAKKDFAKLEEKVDRIEGDLIEQKVMLGQMPTKNDMIEIKEKLSEMRGGQVEIASSVRMLLSKHIPDKNQ